MCLLPPSREPRLNLTRIDWLIMLLYFVFVPGIEPARGGLRR
jgi:hypothetical protein